MVDRQNAPVVPGGSDDIDVAETTRELLKMMNMEEGQAQKAEQLLDTLSRGGTISDVCGVTKQNLELIYSLARNFYNNRKYNDAVTMFRFLCFLDNIEKKYWMGLGATLQMQKEYREAIKAYAYCSILDIDDPRPHLQAGFCLIQLGENDPATAALEASLMAPDATKATKMQAEALLAKLDGEAVKAGA